MEYYHVNIVHLSINHTNVLLQFYFGWKQEEKTIGVITKVD
jgi:hypothetical protein